MHCWTCQELKGLIDSPDCNENESPDVCDITSGWSIDCDESGVPDECEDDCNENGIHDSCDIATEESEDCDDNDVPDECQRLGSCCGPSEFCYECMTENACDLIYGIWGPSGNCSICAMSP